MLAGLGEFMAEVGLVTPLVTPPDRTPWDVGLDRHRMPLLVAMRTDTLGMR